VGRERALVVVSRASLRVADHVVRGGDVLEALRRDGVAAAAVGVPALRELAERGVDLVLGRARGHPEHGVQIRHTPLPHGHATLFPAVPPYPGPSPILRACPTSRTTRAPSSSAKPAR